LKKLTNRSRGWWTVDVSARSLDQGLDQALERMGASQVEVLPVVNRATSISWKDGVLQDVLKAYGVRSAETVE